MTRIARMIYMLSQCKDAKTILRRYSRKWRVFFTRVEKSEHSCRVNNQELALAVTSLRAETENPKQQWRTKWLWLYVGTRSCIYIFVLLQKQEYILKRDWRCLAEAPPMTRIHICCVVNFTHEWHEFLTWMKRVNSKCSSVQLRANSAIYSRHSHLVWTHLEKKTTVDWLTMPYFSVMMSEYCRKIPH